MTSSKIASVFADKDIRLTVVSKPHQRSCADIDVRGIVDGFKMESSALRGKVGAESTRFNGDGATVLLDENGERGCVGGRSLLYFGVGVERTSVIPCDVDRPMIPSLVLLRLLREGISDGDLG
jgi:hypothetical protein